jgi:peptidyl-dipeptidase A
VIPTSDLERFISDFEERLAPVEKAADEAWWNLATSGTEAAQREFVAANKAYTGLFSDPDEYRKLRDLFEDSDSVQNPLLRRRVEVLYRMFEERQGDREVLGRAEELEAEANAIYGNHRSVVEGKKLVENEVRELLRTSEDEGLRREAWEASKSVGRAVEGTVRELARLRNRLAREQGYENHYARSLELQEIEAGELAGIMEDLASATDAPFGELKRALDAELKRKFGVDEIMPWHLSGPFFHRAPDVAGVDLDRYFVGKDLEDLTRKTFDGLGLDVRGVIPNSDLYEREGKSQHAFCARIGREYPYDVRVLANIRPDAYWMDAMLHEFGHAVYDQQVDRSLPYFLRAPAHTLTTEASALLLGRLSRNAEWLAEYAAVPEDEAGAAAGALERARTATLLVSARWQLVMCHFERALYADPERDLDTYWWDLVERFQQIRRPDGRIAPDWAAKVHFSVSPAYYQNYLLGEITASQLQARLLDDVLGGGDDAWRRYVTSPEVGRWLRERLYASGATRDWRETIEHATGRPLEPDAFVRELARAL